MRPYLPLVFAFILLLTCFGRLRAQPNTLYFIKGVPQTKDLNPARPGIKDGYYISMPLLSKIDLSVNTNNWSYNDLIHRGTGAQSDSLVYDFAGFISGLDSINFLGESTSLTLFEYGYRKEGNFFSFSWSERQFSEAFFTKNLTELLYYGNTPFLGKTYHSGYFGIGGQHYREFAFTWAKEWNQRFSFGVTSKLLFGLAGMKTSGLNVIAGMPANGDQIDLNASGTAFFSVPIDIQVVNDKGYQLLTHSNFSSMKYLSNFGNPGLALDLGVSAKINSNLELSASMIDLGFISWRRDVTTFAENGHYLFRGINLNTPTETNKPPEKTDAGGLFVALYDSMRTSFYPNPAVEKFTSILPVKLYLAGEYKMNDRMTLGGVARMRLYNNLLHASYTASLNAKISRNFAFSASYSLLESTINNLGVAAVFHIGNIQLYTVSDNVLAFTFPSSARNANLRIGINYCIDSEKIRGTWYTKNVRQEGFR